MFVDPFQETTALYTMNLASAQPPPSCDPFARHLVGRNFLGDNGMLRVGPISFIFGRCQEKNQAISWESSRVNPRP